MPDDGLLAASCRVALAAYGHDFGKFAERARIDDAERKDADGSTRGLINRQLYCPQFDGRYTHVHAAYTGLAFDLMEPHLPALIGDEMHPFAPWRDRDADDSLINAAAMHHKPETFLQWIIATADRLASGFEREDFDAYNRAPDQTAARKNHYTARQWTLLEQIRLTDRPATSGFRYPLQPLSPGSIFPVAAEGYEMDDSKAAQSEYRALWNGFLAGLQAIPPAHRHHLPLWLDHFDTLWQTFTHAIPSATAGKVKPEVSLYDHAKTTAALAVALWRFHADQEDASEVIREQLCAQWDRRRAGSAPAQDAWTSAKFLLIQGDFFGIQDFIFASGGETQRQVAKLLRGRSFYVSLLTELAALKVLDALHLPPTSQVVNAAGKFLIVAPNTPAAHERLGSVQTELDRWFLTHTYGQCGIGLASLPASCADFRGGSERNAFGDLMKRLFQRLETAKLQRFDLCGSQPAPAVFDGFLGAFDNTKGVCAIDGRSPALLRLEESTEVYVSALAHDQIATGQWLAAQQRVLVTREDLNHHTLRLPVFGYRVSFTGNEEESGNFGAAARRGNLRRAWDFSLPEAFAEPLWNGYARRHINAYVPRLGELNDYERDRYRGLDEPEHADEIKTLNHLALDDRRVDQDGRWIGAEALTVLKGDVDNLGTIFQRGLEHPTFAKMAALSRQMNAFFAIYLPWLCARGREDGTRPYRNTYTVFAGGDDFFLIGPWHATLRLARRMRAEFERYVANPDIHFSAGMAMTKPGLPIRHLARMADQALDQAKSHQSGRGAKNAVTCFGQTVGWPQFDELMKREQGLAHLAKDFGLSTGYLYGLLHLTDMAGGVKKKPQNALWHAYFAYRTRRLAEARIKGGENRDETERRRRTWQGELAHEIAGEGIEKYGAAYKIALFTYLYQQRD